MEKKKFYLFHWNPETKTRHKVEVVAIYIGGSEWKAICPFHDDHKPSLNINEDKKVYHCLGCGKKGQLWKDKLDPDFPEVIRDENGEVMGISGSIGQFLRLEIERLKRKQKR